MRHKAQPRIRRATTTVEAAIVLPVALFLIFGLIIGALGVFRYQETAHIARETARFAIVHGGQYAKIQAVAIQAGTQPSVDKQYLINFAKGKAIGLDPNNLQITVTMTVLSPGAGSATTETVDWDDTAQNQQRSPYSAWTNSSLTPPQNIQLGNVVMVTVSYQWTPELYLMGPITLSSTAVMPMSY